MPAPKIYELNIYQNLHFMHKLKNDDVPNIFTELIKKLKHNYPTRFSKNSYTSESFFLSNMKYIVSGFEDQSYGMNFWKTKKRKFNIFLLTFSKSCKIKTENEVMYL